MSYRDTEDRKKKHVSDFIKYLKKRSFKLNEKDETMVKLYADGFFELGKLYALRKIKG